MLALVMFLNGLAVMVLEMVGARLLAPQLGTSTIVWTSLIGVILGSLSLGYWLGGRLADKYVNQAESSGADAASARKSRKAPLPAAHGQDRTQAAGKLSNILLAAALFVTLTALLHGPILEELAGMGSPLYISTVLAAVLLFAVPAVLCGMVSPYAMRLAITDSQTSGSVIGRLNAISTVGSIVGTFLGGFILLAWFGSREITFGVAGCLVLAALLAKRRPVLPKVLLALTLCGLAMSFWAVSASKAGQGRYVALETPYSSIRILTQDNLARPTRLLITDPGSCQSGQYLDDPAELVFEYTKFYALGPYFRPDASRILMLGGGGYSIPKWLLAGRSALSGDDFLLDVVEIDPGMTKAAVRWFDLPVQDRRLRIFHEDGRSFLNHQAGLLPQDRAGRYDLIFADCFNSYYTVPFHMGTVEAAARINDLLEDDGLVIMNIISAIEGDNGRLFRSIYRAFAEVFPEVRIYAVNSGYHGQMIQNVMLIASPKPFLPHKDYRDFPPAIQSLLRKEWTRPLPEDAWSCPALTDNYAPVERYTLGFVR